MFQDGYCTTKQLCHEASCWMYKRDKSSEFSKRPNPVTWKDSEGESSPNGRTIQISEVFKFTQIDIYIYI